MKFFDTISRRAFAVLAAVSCAVCAAVPAAADAVYPVWYHGAVKAMDRMGISEADYPVWLRSDVASRIPQMHGDVVIDADLAARPDGVVSDADVDKAVDRRAARLVYKDTTVDLVKLWDVYGKTYADGYAQSNSGALHYGDAGYVPTSDEIDEWSRKLTVTTSELDRDAEVGAADASVSAVNRPSAYHTCGNRNHARAASYMVRTAGDVIPYSKRKMKKSEQYTELYTWDLDDGSGYAQQILEEEAKKGNSDAFSKNRDIHSLRDMEWGRHATARDRRIHKRLEKVKKAHQTLNHAVDTFNAWTEPFEFVRNGLHQTISWFLSDDDFCDMTHATGNDSHVLDNSLRFVYGILGDVNCDEYDAANFPADGEAATSIRRFAGQKLAPKDDIPDDRYGLGSPVPDSQLSWSPWYRFDAGEDGAVALRFPVYKLKDRYWVVLNNVTRPDSKLSNAIQSADFGLLSMVDAINEGKPRNPAGLWLLMPHPDDKSLEKSLSISYHIHADSTTVGWPDALVSGDDPKYGLPGDLKYRGSKYSPGQFAAGTLSKMAVQVPSLDWFADHLRLFYTPDGKNTKAPNHMDVTDSATEHNFHDIGRESDWKGTDFAKNVLKATVCDAKSCPSQYQKVKPRVKATAKDDQGDTLGVTEGRAGATDDEPNQVPATVSVPVGSDGKTAPTNVSYDADDGQGNTVHVGDVSLPSVDTSTIGKRLDLIDLSTGRSCFSEGYACAPWYLVTQQLMPDHQLTVHTKTTTKEQPGMTYKCSYDVPGKITEVPIGECVAYAHAFDEDAQRTGATASDPYGNAISDPVTSADPKVDYGTCLRRETEGNAAKWLYEPMACAGRVLFKPDDQVTRTTRTKVERSTRDSVVVKLDLIRDNWRPVFSDGLGDCSGYRVSFKFAGIPVFHDADFLDACPGQPLDWLPVLCRAFLTIVCALGVMLLCRRAFMAIFDFHTGGDGQ
ncbi:hypothetical protein I6E06_01235 [Bifidobacterium boum]|uniref:hypothetical protein n=1 Tax=Bifidobacterium boum TaxID=78343 RepID=UPI001F460A95|nr:hypothetical protein [Bifidobacterium boum]MCF2561122.1 hypothetical protein [Bifidobacterium boum]